MVLKIKFCKIDLYSIKFDYHIIINSINSHNHNSDSCLNKSKPLFEYNFRKYHNFISNLLFIYCSDNTVWQRDK